MAKYRVVCERMGEGPITYVVQKRILFLWFNCDMNGEASASSFIPTARFEGYGDAIKYAVKLAAKTVKHKRYSKVVWKQ